jgi:hypothetical protein
VTHHRIAIVTSALLGYVRTSGIGTATTFLALALARMGHRVDILYYARPAMDPVDPEWVRVYHEFPINVQVLPDEETIEPSYFAGTARVAKTLLSAQPDVVIAQEFGGPAYSALRLRSLGLAFDGTLFVVLCHGTRLWSTDMSRKVRVLPPALAITNLERASLELADVVVSPRRTS